MRNRWMCMLPLLAACAVQAQEVTPTRIHGQIKDFAGGNVLMYYNKKADTLRVDKNGIFDYSVVVEKPRKTFLLFEDYRCSVDFFIENGMDACLTISFIQKPYRERIIYEPQVLYEGDNKDCTEFMGNYQNWSLYANPWTFPRLDTLSFAEYREKFQQDVDSVKRELMKVKSLAFRQMMTEQIDGSIVSNLFRFGWSKLREDADFDRWLESFDRNDPENMRIASDYLRYYLRRHRDSLEPGDLYLNSLGKVFTNQEIINAFADDYVDMNLKQAPEEMEALLEQYKKVSTNTEAHAKAEAVYAHYSKLRKGAPAINFEMTGAKGKKFRLSDFRGKAVYIDVWATWCGPCCAEIPHMEKLAKHYAKNKKVELISISLDSSKAKWEKKLAQDKPMWKQFICPDNFESVLCKNYDINGIPRFLFFDKDGKVISLNAPRPSSSDIIQYIDEHLTR